MSRHDEIEIRFDRIAGNDRMEVYRLTDFGQPRIMFHARTGHDDKAALAIALVERWGLVAGAPDGEDSAGRQKVAPMPVPELVERACSTAEALHEAFAARGWSFDIPGIELDRKGDA